MGRLVAFVGTYGAAPGTKGGGIFSFGVSQDGSTLEPIGHAPEPKDAGYLVYAPERRRLYSVDERKTDGRGPVDKPAAVHALAVDPVTGDLAWEGSAIAPGPRPTFLDWSAEQGLLVSANHGDFQHVEKVVRQADGDWTIEYVYDDSTLVVYPLDARGNISRACDVHVFSGKGKDPNFSLQNGGHAQSNPHAHCAVIDPSGSFVIVCDKGTDRIETFRLGRKLEHVHSLQFPEETGPRHIAFDPINGLAYATLEFSSQLASLRFDPETGEMSRLSEISTLSAGYTGPNEPAEVRVHPGGGLVYVNNRGEDSLTWFRSDSDGRLVRLGGITLAPSIHPGLAARNFTFDPSGAFVLVADRPADLVRSYAVCPNTGALTWLGQVHVPDPAFVAFAELEECAS
ncbi:lactonase family protein [Novosphingobium mathurense]|uniref:6-phosphogluconolactonase n=1 Tax=Novosphingobium mathurense TaxID=428990 RepID=A0A1U6IM74_9SPHN|nr:beta-propeller fold lactonase family protein [Novosphingobium mathurense]SLK09113.1 6-phosphogluconolactonase [Novosphingobium mathurense]